MPVLCKLGSSEQIITPDESREGYIRSFEDKQRPSPLHVMSADGLWIIPVDTKESVAKKRKARYVELGADELLGDIVRDERRGKDVTVMLEEWNRIQDQVREELPYPDTPSHYQAVKEPTSG